MGMIALDETLEARLRTAAAARGEDYNHFAVAAILEAVERQERLRTPRGKPLAQFIDEQRTKHGFSKEWGTGKPVLSPDDWAALDAACAELYPETSASFSSGR
jgi:hypothetical protein